MITHIKARACIQHYFIIKVNKKSTGLALWYNDRKVDLPASRLMYGYLRSLSGTLPNQNFSFTGTSESN